MTGPHRLSAWRKRKGFSQTDVAALLGVKQGTVSRWEAGEFAPILKFAIRLAQISKQAVPVSCWTDDKRRAA